MSMHSGAKELSAEMRISEPSVPAAGRAALAVPALGADAVTACVLPIRDGKGCITSWGV